MRDRSERRITAEEAYRHAPVPREDVLETNQIIEEHAM